MQIPDMLSDLGTTDAAYDSRGKSAAEATHYLAQRFGLPTGELDLIRRLLRRKSPAAMGTFMSCGWAESEPCSLAVRRSANNPQVATTGRTGN
jgi:hypothetical protein